MSKPVSSVPLYARVLIGVTVGIVLGVVFGDQPYLLGLSNKDFGPLGMLVIRLLKALATPLVCLAILDSFLKTSISMTSGLRLLAVCTVNIGVAMLLGLTILWWFDPGSSWHGHLSELEAVKAAPAAVAPDGTSLSPLKNLAGFVPESVVEPFSKNLVISVVLLSVLAGAALRFSRDQAGGVGESIELLGRLIEASLAVVTRMLLWVAEAMPVAVALIIADVVGKSGIGVFKVLWVFLATTLAGLLIHSLVYYPLVAWGVGRKSPAILFGKGLDAVVTAVSCNSSLATMPVTLKCLKDMGVSERAARLSACVGTNFNNDGIMLYEAMATLFLCQALGFDLDLGQQITVVAAAVMAGVGIAGIPEAGLVILPLVLTAAGIPEATIAVMIPLIVPVDWIIARVRSGVNVLADMTVATVLNRWEHDEPT